MSFAVGDMIAHPLHGAGIIESIERRRVGGVEREYYMMIVGLNNMLVMIPTDSCEKVGIRPVMNCEELEEVCRRIPDMDVEEDSNWNKRYRENMTRIRSGNLLEVASVIKSLKKRENKKGLSNGERKMLYSAKQIILSEMLLAQGGSLEEAENRLFAAMC